MAQEWALWFYRSKAWQRCRAGFISSVYGLCQRCYSPGLIVHHKISLTPGNINNPEITLNWEHLEYLCQLCHNKETFGTNELLVREGLKFNSFGDLVQE